MAYKLGNYLRNLRGNLSLREVTMRTNGRLSHNTIAQAEKGLNSHGAPYKPTPDTLKELARVYQTDYSVLMNLAGYLLPPEYVHAEPTADGAQITADNPNHSEEELERIINTNASSQKVVLADQKNNVYGQIHAGAPSFADQDIIGTTLVTPELIDTYGIANLFALQIKGDSMSHVLPDGFVAVFAKDVEIENGDIVAVLINGDEATIKRFRETSMAIMFEPDSYNPTYKPIVFPKTGEQDCKILGKYLYSTDMPI